MELAMGVPPTSPRPSPRTSPAPAPATPPPLPPSASSLADALRLRTPRHSPTPSEDSQASASSMMMAAGGTVSSISSRLSVRHGISEESLVLLTASPPETRLTDLAYSPAGSTAADSAGGGGGATLVDTQTGATVKRHPDLWFDDGSVICRAEDTLFCVHMSQLARHSLVFHDMVTLSHPEATRVESTMLVPGSKTTASRKVPVVYLYDSAEDVGNLLTALYDGPTFGNNDEDDFRVVSGILRLSTKYLIDSLRAKALAHLSLAWPSDLKTWDAREDLARSFEMEGNPTRYPHPYTVINLAREVNAPSLLPAAFYDLSRYSVAQIFEPTEDDPLYRSPPPSPLLSHDMQRLFLGKEASQHTITTLITSMGSGQYIRHPQSNALSGLGHSSSSPHARKGSAGGVCVSAAACRKDFTELVDLATQHYLFDRERGCGDPLYVAEELGQLKSAEFSECKACARALEAWAARERERMWKLIPLWFRLEAQGGGGGEASPTIVTSFR